MRKRVYISGPITQGDRNWNQFQANIAHKALLKAGYAVLNPMPTGVLPFAWDGSVEHHEWLESDFAFVAVCDLVVRLPGASKGGDMETDYAKSLGIPVLTVDEVPCLRGLLPQWEPVAA